MKSVRSKTQNRSEVAAEETWKITDLFSSETEWKQALHSVEKDSEAIVEYKGKLGENSSQLLKCLQLNEAVRERVVRIFTYASLNLSADGTDTTNQANAAIADAFYSNMNARLSFIQSEILEIPEETILSFLEEEAGLQDFSKVLHDLLETKPHRLSAETEEVLASLGEVLDAPYMIYQRSKTSDMTFSSFKTSDGTEHPLTFNTFPMYEESADTELRRKGYAAFNQSLSQYKHTYAATYATEIKKQIVEAKLRKFHSVTDMLLHQQQVTNVMYQNQLNTILKELAPHMRRYAKLKQRVLGLEAIHYSDLKAPLDPNYNPETTYEEASQLILDSVEVMGEEYKEIIKQGLEDQWVDRADNIGKRSGAFCSSPYGAHPYILMTWSNSMRNTFTLAHELGHAAHFVLAGRNQSISNVRASRYFIEAPSTMNEMLLSKHILKQSDNPNMRRFVVLESLGTYYHNFVTHILEGECQRRIYALAEQGVPITADVLCEQTVDLLKSFWGDSVVIDEGAGLTWMRQPHYYMGLYPYTYSAGLTASTAASKMIEEEGKPAVDRWLKVLKAGGTLKPYDLMKLAHVDMATAAPIQTAVAYVGSLVDELEESFTIA